MKNQKRKYLKELFLQMKSPYKQVSLKMKSFILKQKLFQKQKKRMINNLIHGVKMRMKLDYILQQALILLFNSHHQWLLFQLLKKLNFIFMNNSSYYIRSFIHRPITVDDLQNHIDDLEHDLDEALAQIDANTKALEDKDMRIDILENRLKQMRIDVYINRENN